MSLRICHHRALAKYWICSRARRQPWTDEVYAHEGCCGQKSFTITENIEITSTPAFCQVTPGECRELRTALLFLQLSLILVLYGIILFGEMLWTGLI